MSSRDEIYSLEVKLCREEFAEGFLTKVSQGGSLNNCHSAGKDAAFKEALMNARLLCHSEEFCYNINELYEIADDIMGKTFEEFETYFYPPWGINTESITTAKYQDKAFCVAEDFLTLINGKDFTDLPTIIDLSSKILSAWDDFLQKNSAQRSSAQRGFSRRDRVKSE